MVQSRSAKEDMLLLYKPKADAFGHETWDNLLNNNNGNPNEKMNLIPYWIFERSTVFWATEQSTNLLQMTSQKTRFKQMCNPTSSFTQMHSMQPGQDFEFPK